MTVWPLWIKIRMTNEWKSNSNKREQTNQIIRRYLTKYDDVA